MTKEVKNGYCLESVKLTCRSPHLIDVFNVKGMDSMGRAAEHLVHLGGV